MKSLFLLNTKLAYSLLLIHLYYSFHEVFLKKIICILTLVLFNNLYASDCILKNARVSYVYRPASQAGSTYYVVGNLDRQIQIPIKESTNNSELANALKKSDGDKDIFLNFKLEPNICATVMKAEAYQSYLIMPEQIKSTVISHNNSVDCVECTTFNNAPISIRIPPMKEMRNILDKAAGFSPDKVDLVSHLLVDLFERMNSKTPNANSLVFSVSLFKVFQALNVSSIDHEQLNYLVTKFKDQLSSDQYKLLQVIFNKVDKIVFTNKGDFQSELKILTVDKKPISIKNNDIPVIDQQTRDYINKYFNNIEIANDTTMAFSDKAIINKSTSSRLVDLENKTFVAPTTVAINGITVAGQFPILGGITVTPLKLDVDIDSQIPIKADVGFKKGFLGFSYTFNINN